jgi:hypothetical protein
VSKTTSYPIQTPFPIFTPRQRCKLTRRLRAPGAISCQLLTDAIPDTRQQFLFDFLAGLRARCRRGGEVLSVPNV